MARRQFFAGKVPDYTDFDETAVQTAERWLAAGPPGPWLLFVPLIAPHLPFRAPEPWHSMYDPAAMPDPAPSPRPDDGPEPRFYQAIRP